MAALDHSIVNEPRSSGVLLHPTSLAGRFGIGTFGPEASEFIDFLARAGQRLWQVCPLGPTGYGDSPYQCFSAFAGNPLLIGLEQLVDDGLLSQDDLSDAPPVGEKVDYGAIIPWKTALLQKAFAKFREIGTSGSRARLEQFEHLHAHLARRLTRSSWRSRMPTRADPGPNGRRRYATAMRLAIAEFASAQKQSIALRKFQQWLFHTQWFAIRAEAQSYDITDHRRPADLRRARQRRRVGAPGTVQLDEEGNPTVVAGVPPDYFSATGQLWGNPIYDWDVHREDGFAVVVRCVVEQVLALRSRSYRSLPRVQRVLVDPGGRDNGAQRFLGRIAGPRALLGDRGACWSDSR